MISWYSSTRIEMPCFSIVTSSSIMSLQAGRPRDNGDSAGYDAINYRHASWAEGIVSKRLGSRSPAGPADWVKLKKPKSPAVIRHAERSGRGGMEHSAG